MSMSGPPHELLMRHDDLLIDYLRTSASNHDALVIISLALDEVYAEIRKYWTENATARILGRCVTILKEWGQEGILL